MRCQLLLAVPVKRWNMISGKILEKYSLYCLWEVSAAHKQIWTINKQKNSRFNSKISSADDSLCIFFLLFIPCQTKKHHCCNLTWSLCVYWTDEGLYLSHHSFSFLHRRVHNTVCCLWRVENHCRVSWNDNKKKFRLVTLVHLYRLYYRLHSDGYF